MTHDEFFKRLMLAYVKENAGNEGATPVRLAEESINFANSAFDKYLEVYSTSHDLQWDGNQ